MNLRWCREISGDEVTVDRTRLKISRGMKKDFVTRLSDALAGAVNIREGGG